MVKKWQVTVGQGNGCFGSYPTTAKILFIFFLGVAPNKKNAKCSLFNKRRGQFGGKRTMSTVYQLHRGWKERNLWIPACISNGLPIFWLFETDVINLGIAARQGPAKLQREVIKIRVSHEHSRVENSGRAANVPQIYLNFAADAYNAIIALSQTPQYNGRLAPNLLGLARCLKHLHTRLYNNI